MNGHQQGKPYSDIWWWNWWSVVKDGAGQEFELLRVRAVVARVQQVWPLGLQGVEETNASGHRQKSVCPPALARLLAAIALLKFVLPLSNPGWALQGGGDGRTAGSVNKGQMFSEERVVFISGSTLITCNAGDLQLHCWDNTMRCSLWD